MNNIAAALIAAAISNAPGFGSRQAFALEKTRPARMIVQARPGGRVGRPARVRSYKAFGLRSAKGLEDLAAPPKTPKPSEGPRAKAQLREMPENESSGGKSYRESADADYAEARRDFDEGSLDGAWSPPPWLRSGPQARVSPLAAQARQANGFDEALSGLARELLARANADRRLPIPMPKLVISDKDSLNAHANSRSPFEAEIGVHRGYLEAVLVPENLRRRLLGAMRRGVYRRRSRLLDAALAGSIAGFRPATRMEGVEKAAPSELKSLGMRLLRFTLAHEFIHILREHGGSRQKMEAFMPAPPHPLTVAVVAAQIGALERLAAMLPPAQTNLAWLLHLSALALPAALTLSCLLRHFCRGLCRGQELQADAEGAALAGDPEAAALMLALFEAEEAAQRNRASEGSAGRLARLRGRLSRLLWEPSTHPSDDSRISALERLAAS